MSRDYDSCAHFGAEGHACVRRCRPHTVFERWRRSEGRLLTVQSSSAVSTTKGSCRKRSGSRPLVHSRSLTCAVSRALAASPSYRITSARTGRGPGSAPGPGVCRRKGSGRPAVHDPDRAPAARLSGRAVGRLVDGRARPTHPRPAAHWGVPAAVQGSGPGDGTGVAGARVDRHDEHLPAPPRLVGGPGRAGASQRAGGAGGVRIRRGTSNDKARTPPLRWCFRWWDGVSVWWS
jgi:hypothetical protein